jgi:hypothetical protein
MNIGVYLRSPALRRVGQIDDWTSLEVIQLWQGLSSWKVGLPGQYGDWEPGAGVSILLDDAQLIAGPKSTRQRTYIETEQGRTDEGVPSGYEDGVWLQRRRVPAGETRTGPIESLLHGFAGAHVGPDAGARAVPRVTMGTDLGRGPTSTVRANDESVFDLCQTAAALAFSDVAFGIANPLDSGQLIFETYGGTDRTSAGAFDVDLGTLAGYQSEVGAPTATRLTVRGASGVTTEVIDQELEAVWGRIEGPPLVKTDSSDVASLSQAGTVALDKAKSRIAVSTTPVATTSWQLGVHYNLGDLVTVYVDGEALTARVSEVHYTASPNSLVDIKPVLTTAGGSNPTVPRLIPLVRSLSQRVAILERSI